MFLQLKRTDSLKTNSPVVHALLRQNEVQLAYDEKVIILPNRPSFISIVGLPGTKGALEIQADSQVFGKPLVITVPFQLSPCPIGYGNPVEMTSITGETVSFTKAN